MKIINTPTESKKGPDSHFTGSVWTDEIAVPAAPSRLRVHHVYFSPGSRTAWHCHPVGQLLQITGGQGRVQRRGGTVKTVRAGDTVWFEPQEWHWHGAAPASFMSHLSVQETDANGTAAELGSHVSDSDDAA